VRYQHTGPPDLILTCGDFFSADVDATKIPKRAPKVTFQVLVLLLHCIFWVWFWHLPVHILAHSCTDSLLPILTLWMSEKKS